jgi:putative redox protein
MICATSEVPRYRTRFSNGKHDGAADATAEKGGAEAGFRPHDLLEAALATCVNMSVRMFADRHSMPLGSVTASVRLDRSGAAEAVFRYTVALEGDLTADQRRELLRAAEACPVRRTLSRGFAFECAAEDPRDLEAV